MPKYLLIILLFSFLTIHTASSQMVTIYPYGRKSILLKRKVSESFTTDSLYSNKQSDSIHRIIPLKIPASYSDLKAVTNLSAPLLKRLYVTSDFGARYNPVLQKEAFHTGIDLRACYDTILSIAGGIIIKEGYNLRSGNFMIVDHGNGVESIYCHLNNFLLNKGDGVLAGSRIAISGATGAVTGPHLHFALKVNEKFADPIPLLKIIEQFNRKKV